MVFRCWLGLMVLDQLVQRLDLTTLAIQVVEDTTAGIAAILKLVECWPLFTLARRPKRIALDKLCSLKAPSSGVLSRSCIGISRK